MKVLKPFNRFGYFVLNGVAHTIQPINEYDNTVRIQIKSAKAWSAPLDIHEDQWKAIVCAEYWRYFGENNDNEGQPETD